MADAARQEYMRQWRLANPDKVAAGIAKSIELRKAKWGEFLAREKLRYAANKEAVSERQKARIARNPAKRCEIVKKSYEKNKHKFIARVAQRRAAKLQATPAWADLQKIEQIYEEARQLSASTGIPHEVDHIFPLRGKTVCGLHIHTNLRIVTRQLNRSKGNSIAQGVFA